MKKLISICGSELTNEIETDFKSSVKIASFKAGEKALYFPKLFDWEYIAYSEIKSATIRNREMSTKGCCGVSVTVPSMIIEYSDVKRIEQLGSKKDIAKLKELISKADTQFTDLITTEDGNDSK